MFITSRESAAINVSLSAVWLLASPGPGENFYFCLLSSRGGNFRSKRVIAGLIQEVNRELPVSTAVWGVSLGLVPFFCSRDLKILGRNVQSTTTACGIDAHGSLFRLRCY